MWPPATPVQTSTDRPAWLAARRTRITSTDVAKAATPSGWDQVVAEKLYGAQMADNEWFRHGREREPEIGLRAHQKFRVAPNSILFERAGLAATPDGIGEQGDLGEYKTSTKPLPKTVPRVYRDQIYIAQYVMGADRTLLGWEQHLNGVPVDLEPTWLWIERDNARITVLLEIANDLRDFLARERLYLAY